MYKVYYFTLINIAGRCKRIECANFLDEQARVTESEFSGLFSS